MIEGTAAEAIVQIPGGVAVVAKSYWEAEMVARSLDLEFAGPAADGRSSVVRTFHEQLTR